MSVDEANQDGGRTVGEVNKPMPVVRSTAPLKSTLLLLPFGRTFSPIQHLYPEGDRMALSHYPVRHSHTIARFDRDRIQRRIRSAHIYADASRICLVIRDRDPPIWLRLDNSALHYVHHARATIVDLRHHKQRDQQRDERERFSQHA